MTVTNRHIVIDSGSTRKARSIWSVPTGTHENSVTTVSRSSDRLEQVEVDAGPATTNDANTIVVAR